MYRTLISLAAMFCVAWGSVVIGGSAPTSGGSGGGATQIFAEDFESDTGESDCLLLTQEAEAVSTNPPDCGHVTAPLAGTWSMDIDAQATPDQRDVDWTDDWSEPCDNGNLCRFKFLWKVTTEGSAGADRIAKLSTSTTHAGSVYYQSNTGKVGCSVQDDNGARTIVITAGTLYKVCFELDIANATAAEGTIYIDPGGGTYCAGATGTETCTNTTTSITSVLEHKFTVRSGGGIMKFDNIVIEEE